MKSTILLMAAAAITMYSCSRSYKSVTVDNINQARGFKNVAYTEKDAYVIATVRSVTDDWDGDEGKEFTPESGNKLVRVELSTSSTVYKADYVITDANFELYDKSTKATHTALVKLDRKPKFNAGQTSGYRTGYVVFEVPVSSKPEDLFLSLNLATIEQADLSKANIEDLVPLTPYDESADKETVKNINQSFEEVNSIWDATIKYTIKDIVYFSKDKQIEPMTGEIVTENLVKITMDITHESKQGSVWFNAPVLLTNYGTVMDNSELSSDESSIKPGETLSLEYYFVLPRSAKALSIVSGLSGDYVYNIKL